MAPEVRQKISYVLPLADTSGGHRLGINGLAVDTKQSILYSGGRDGQICAWDLKLDLQDNNELARESTASAKRSGSHSQTSTVLIKEVQAHSHWINDIVLAHSNSALVSASSDITVKLWRPHSSENVTPTTIGVHSDYVKCVASPSQHSEWIASGGLDHKINLWDLNGYGQRLQIDAGEPDKSAKSSVYALGAKRSVLASGGPENVVRLWDSRTGKRITNFVGHTDNIRDILLDEECDTVMTASSDQSIKVWSITAGRCMYTLTMHNDSVWSLYSDHPTLSLFYSSDRSGVIAKTDVRNCEDMDQGMSIAVAKEQEGVCKIVEAGGHLWAATSSSSINRWQDFELGPNIEIIQPTGDGDSTRDPGHYTIPVQPYSPTSHCSSASKLTQIPLSCCLRISLNAPIPGVRANDAEVLTLDSAGRSTAFLDAYAEHDGYSCIPYRELPEHTMEGQKGLIKHVILNDRRRVLTLDTTGDVVMWDLLQCSQINSFGKRHLDDVRAEVDRSESIANWCAVDTQTGRLVVVLEKNHCFDAELYADELNLDNAENFREDQRINLGKWVLRYLFVRFIDAEIDRDATYRKHLAKRHGAAGGSSRFQPATSTSLARISSRTSGDQQDDQVSAKVNAINPLTNTPITSPTPANVSGTTSNNPLAVDDEGSNHFEPGSQNSNGRASIDRVSDTVASTDDGKPQAELQGLNQQSQGDNERDHSNTTSPAEPKEDKSGASLFGKKFRMNFPRKLGRGSNDTKPSVIDEKSESRETSDTKQDKSNEHLLVGTIDEVRLDYEAQLQTYPTQAVISGITPSLNNDTPRLQHPPYTTLIIQEEQPNAGGAVDLYQGTVSSAGRDIDVIEKVAPRWLGELLLRNHLPEKELGKVSFVLLPYKDLLPGIANSDGNTRLTANRMLRVKKILTYVAERIESPPAGPDQDAMKAEEYLELLCQNQLISNNTTLATLKAHIWKTGGDVVLYYKSNGKKQSLEKVIAQRAATISAAETAGKVGPGPMKSRVSSDE